MPADTSSGSAGGLILPGQRRRALGGALNQHLRRRRVDRLPGRHGIVGSLEVGERQAAADALVGGGARRRATRRRLGARGHEPVADAVVVAVDDPLEPHAVAARIAPRQARWTARLRRAAIGAAPEGPIRIMLPCRTVMPLSRFPSAWRTCSTPRSTLPPASHSIWSVEPVRDLLRGDPGITDVDLAVDGDAAPVARSACPRAGQSGPGDRARRVRHLDGALGGHARRHRPHAVRELRPARIAARRRARRHRGRSAAPRLHRERHGASARERRQPARSGGWAGRPRAAA